MPLLLLKTLRTLCALRQLFSRRRIVCNACRLIPLCTPGIFCCHLAVDQGTDTVKLTFYRLPGKAQAQNGPQRNKLTQALNVWTASRQHWACQLLMSTPKEQTTVVTTNHSGASTPAVTGQCAHKLLHAQQPVHDTQLAGMTTPQRRHVRPS